jgi:phosphotransferase system enzyme I (PtsI)
MGLRGVRLFLRHTDLFKTQLRAILRASLKGKVKILIPMVSSIGEIHGVKRLLAQAQAELQAEGLEVMGKVELGIMVEIPSAALMLDSFLPLIDFVSIGTNDLIQYTLAVDRINEHVSHLYDPFHPAVLKLLEEVVKMCHKKDKPVGVCGEMCSDPHAVPLLVGLGVDSFSVSPRMHLRIKQTVRGLKYAAMAKVVSQALGCSDSDQIRHLLADQGL